LISISWRNSGPASVVYTVALLSGETASSVTGSV
jgi:hypothetical protein